MHYPNKELPPMVKCMFEQAGLKLRTNHSLSNRMHSSFKSRCDRKTNVIRKLQGTATLSVLPLKKTRKQQKQTISTMIVDFGMEIWSDILGFETFRMSSSTPLFNSSKTLFSYCIPPTLRWCAPSATWIRVWVETKFEMSSLDLKCCHQLLSSTAAKLYFHAVYP